MQIINSLNIIAKIRAIPCWLLIFDRPCMRPLQTFKFIEINTQGV